MMNPENIAHTGRLYRYKQEKLRGGRWKESWAVLLTDSTFFWYNDKHCSDLRGKVAFQDVYKDVEVSDGVEDKFGSKTVKPPLSLSPEWLFVVPTAARLSGSKLKKDGSTTQYQWFCAKSEEDLAAWVSAFAAILHQENQYDSLKKALLATQSNGDSSYNRSGAPITGERKATQGHWGYVWDEIKNALKAPGDLSARPSLISGSAEYRSILSKFSEEDASSIERFVSVSQLSFAGAASDGSGGTPLQEPKGIELELISEDSKSKRLVGGTKKTQRLFLGSSFESSTAAAQQTPTSSPLEPDKNSGIDQPGSQQDCLESKAGSRMNIEVEAHVHEDGVHYAMVNEPQMVTVTHIAVKKLHLDSIDSGIERDDSPTSSVLDQSPQAPAAS